MYLNFFFFFLALVKLKMPPRMKIIIFEFFVLIKHFLFIISILGILDLAHRKNFVQAIVQCTLGCPKKTNIFCESWHMMGEVIIKWFYFYYFRFRQLFERALLKNQNQIFFAWRNAAGNYEKKTLRIFGNFITQHFLWIYIIFQILIQPKNPRNYFL